jgi:hypothetical protein
MTKYFKKWKQFLLLAEARPGSAHPPGEWLVSIRQVRAVAMATVVPPSDEIPSAEWQATHFQNVPLQKLETCGNQRLPPVSPRQFESVLLQRHTAESFITVNWRSPAIPFNRLALLPFTKNNFICILLRRFQSTINLI